ncbi:MAG: hypothetical protein D6696_05635 [Acidobacteria bacterium]|nr:MAG: hypothetical protein D6696_05635 [Acidobacteriota bacterium]
MKGLLPGPLLAAAVLAGVLASIARFDVDPGAYRVYAPEGYVQEVGRLIGEGKLRYRCEDDVIVPHQLTPGEAFFLRNSYLEGDLERWRRGDRRPFVVEREERPGGACEGRLLAVNASFHKQRLPAYVADAWRGSLYLRQRPGTTTLSSGERDLEVVPAPWSLLPLPPEAFEDAWFGRIAAARQSLRSPRLAFKMHERGRYFAKLDAVGDDAVLEVAGERPHLSLDGCALGVGDRLRLDGGDALRVHEPGGLDQLYSVATGRQAALASSVSEVNGEQRRRTRRERLAMAEDVARAIDAAVLDSRDRPAARDDFDVHLTLDPFLGDRLERALGDFCRQRYGRRPLRAAVTLLEPRSGRVLALASYPTARDEDLLAGLPEASRDLLERNHNVLHHPVGSAAKPFLAAAALAVQPQLARLEVPCFPGGEPPETLLGYRLGPYNLPADCDGANAGGRVDFPGFLTVSSNRYMLFLGLLAMADWQGGGPRDDRPPVALEPLDRYRLGGRAHLRRPRLRIVKDETERYVELVGVETQPFMRAFRDLFDHRIFYRRQGVVDGLALDLWRPVLDVTLGELRHPAAIAFAPITPEEVNLKANLAQQLRQNLYTTLLGNGDNRWSNLQLAEAMARLVTGRAVRARLIERLAVPAAGDGEEEMLFDLETALAQEDAGAWPLPDAARRLILDGMSRVVERPEGTAHERLAPVLEAMSAAAPAAVVYRALGKTGTPSLDLRAVRRSPTEPAPEAIVDYGGKALVNSGVFVAALRRHEGSAVEDLVLAVYVEAQGGSEEAVAATAALLRPLAEAYWPEDWLQPR